MSDHLAEGMSAVQLDELDVNEDPLAKWIQKSELPQSEKQTLTHDLGIAMRECDSQAGKNVLVAQLDHLRQVVDCLVTMRARREIGKKAWKDEPLLAWMALLMEPPLPKAWYEGTLCLRVERTLSETMIQYLASQKTLPESTSGSTIHSEVIDKTVHDFQRVYRGDGMLHLRDHLIRLGKNYQPTRHYARVVPIIQSSGSGKSKTAVELAQVELGVLICLRTSPRELKAVSQPPRDKWVVDWLLPSERGPKSSPSESSDTSDASDSLKIKIWLNAFASEIVSFYRELWGSLESEPWPTNDSVSHDAWSAFTRIAAEKLRPDLSDSLRTDRSVLLHRINKRSQARLEKALEDRERRLAPRKGEKEDRDRLSALEKPTSLGNAMT